ncbi:MAG: terminase family protein [Sphingobacterium sp.]|jgi:hypothetical protein|nr:terminase family protein [Sphingobacterium sp.]
MEGDNVKYIRPQEGYQMKTLSSSADVVIGGGAAGVGKSFTLLLEPLRYKDIEGYGGVIFRRTSPQIVAEGSLWDTSNKIYNLVPGARARRSTLEWEFYVENKKKSKLKFSHLEYEKNIYDWQGSQIPFIGFDELTHFTKKMFFYLLTRNRSVCGVKPYVRATCNPDPDSWVAELIEWWIDQETGYPIPEREGVLRYLVVDGEKYIWGDTSQEVIDRAWYMLEEQVEKSGIDPMHFVKSVTFISGSIYDNKEMLMIDPAYLGNLMAQDEETQAALLKGNWKVVLSDKDVFDYYAFRGCFENNIDVKTGIRYITADIALKGSDKFIVGVWDGWELIDILIMDKSDGKEVIDAIKGLASNYSVQNQHICFDNDGVGSFIDGFIIGAKEFNNGARPFPHPTKPLIDPKTKNPLPENYYNLKTQCYYATGQLVSEGKVIISERVSDKMYDDKQTVRQRFMAERKAIKRDKSDMDGKLCIIPKKQMKIYLNGKSPDLMDMFMMRRRFDYVDNVGQQLPSGNLTNAYRQHSQKYKGY